ncbi:MAG TPA: DUF3037 domain-containing protein [Hanamia sp.]|jgi:hypothetical protein|nr:DUF3037 domain-containing protein [Hanamia sp.]
MQEKQLFEYAVIRIVPRVEREEFLNVGVILYCPKLKFLQTKYHLNKKRIEHFCEQLDLEELEEHLKTFEAISLGKKEAGPIAQLSIAERFRWLTATRSTIVQTSKVHPGFCVDPKKSLDRLFGQLVS